MNRIIKKLPQKNVSKGSKEGTGYIVNELKNVEMFMEEMICLRCF